MRKVSRKLKIIKAHIRKMLPDNNIRLEEFNLALILSEESSTIELIAIDHNY